MAKPRLGPHHLIPSRPFASYAEYLDATGPTALTRARELGPDGVMEELQRSGLRGRGGAGFPTAVKWNTLRSHWCPKRYVVCNAAEGEPGTFKDRWLLRCNPYPTLEGMVIAARVLGATGLYIAMKSSFSRELGRVADAVDELQGLGHLEGLAPELVEGPEEYLFGEEKALLNVIDGTGPLPREAHYPPYERGLFGDAASPNPALVNNAETFAHVPSIVRAGGADFRKLGSADTPGTVIFTVLGDVQRPGVYELEAGLTLRRLFHEVAGGPRPGRSLRAALSGVSSGVIAEDRFDTPADFGSLARIGASLGSAGFMVFDDQASLPRVLQSVARFLYVEACGQCTACKHGLGLASSTLDRIFEPHAVSADLLGRAVRAAKGAPSGNRCFLPVQGSLVTPSFVERFRADFEAQAASAQEPPASYPIPKIVDYVEAEHRFVLDEHQDLKQPDWTYAEPPPERRHEPDRRHASRRGGVARKSDGPRASLQVSLPDALAGELRATAEAEGRSADQVVEDALRAWLAKR